MTHHSAPQQGRVIVRLSRAHICTTPGTNLASGGGASLKHVRSESSGRKKMNVDLSVAPQKHSDDVIGPGPLISSTVYTHCEEVKIFLFLNCV